MSKYVKDLLTTELKSRYESMDSAVWVELVGADGITTNLFRRDLRNKKMRAEVVKNSIFRRAADASKLSPLAKAMSGPAMLVTGGDSAIEVAKVLKDWLPKLPMMKLRGAILEGEFIDEKIVVGLATMPSKRDLQARVAGLLRSPGGRLASAILSPGGNVAGCLKALVEKLEKAGPAVSDASPAEASATTAEAPAAEAPAAAAPAAEPPAEQGPAASA